MLHRAKDLILRWQGLKKTSKDMNEDPLEKSSEWITKRFPASLSRKKWNYLSTKPRRRRPPSMRSKNPWVFVLKIQMLDICRSRFWLGKLLQAACISRSIRSAKGILSNSRTCILLGLWKRFSKDYLKKFIPTDFINKSRDSLLRLDDLFIV